MAPNYKEWLGSKQNVKDWIDNCDNDDPDFKYILMRSKLVVTEQERDLGNMAEMNTSKKWKRKIIVYRLLQRGMKTKQNKKPVTDLRSASFWNALCFSGCHIT